MFTHDLLVEKSTGVLQLGGARMALLDIESGFWGIRRQIEALIGDRLTSSVLQQAGTNGGASFARSFISTLDQTGADAFSACLQTYQSAGFGEFEITTLDWPIGRISIRANQTFEAWMTAQNNQSTNSPCCAYTAGVLVGFVNIIGERQDVVCIERSCQGKGDEFCQFDLLPVEEIKDQAVVSFSPDPGLGRQINLLEMLFERMPMGIAIFDRDYRIQRYNTTWGDFSKLYSPPEGAPLTPGVYYFDHLPGSEQSAVPLFERVLAGETIRADALRFESGGIVSYWDVVLAPLVEDGDVSGILNVTTDATERVQLQQNLEGRVEERTHEIERRREVAESLRDIMAVLNSDRSPQEIFDFITARSGELLKADASMLYSLEGQQVTLEAGYNLPTTLTHLKSGQLYPEEANQSLQNLQPVVIDDARPHLISILEQPDLNDFQRQWYETILENYCSYLAFPLIVRNQLFGGLVLYFEEKRASSEEDIHLGFTLGEHAALAIENTRLRQEEYNRRLESERRRAVAESLREIIGMINSNLPLETFLNRAVNMTAQRLGAAACILHHFDMDNQLLIHLASFGMEGLFEKGGKRRFRELKASGADKYMQATLQRQPTYINYPPLPERIDEIRRDPTIPESIKTARIALRQRFAGSFSVPLFIQDKAYGGMVFYYTEPQDFSDEQIQLGMMFAEQVAVAIENARLHQAEQDRQRELKMLLDVAETANSSLDLDEVLTKTLDLVVALVGASRAGVILLDEQTGTLTPRSLRPEQAIEPNDLAVMVQTSQAVIASGETLYVALDIDKGLLEPGALLPLKIRSKILGILVIIGSQGGEFTQEQLVLFKSIADQLGVAVENARLFERTEDAAIASERNRLARDLHDAVSQTLFSASLIADVLPKLWERNPEVGEQKLAELRQLTRGALSEMRTLLLELRPAVLVDTDLGDLLRHLTNAFTGRTRIPATLTLDGQFDPPPDIKEVFYRVAQESLNNINKHAEATQVSINLQLSEKQVQMEIRDNGCGFDPQAVSLENLGLGIMRERAETIGAQLEIQSDVGAGTCIELLWKEGQK